MPFINPKLRPQYDRWLDGIEKIPSKGELEYCVFKLMRRFMKTRDERYTELHDAVYGVAHCSHEYERLYLDKREDAARLENGDIN